MYRSVIRYNSTASQISITKIATDISLGDVLYFPVDIRDFMAVS